MDKNNFLALKFLCVIIFKFGTERVISFYHQISQTKPNFYTFIPNKQFTSLAPSCLRKNFWRRVRICTLERGVTLKIVSDNLPAFVHQNRGITGTHPHNKKDANNYRKPFDKECFLVPVFLRFCHQICNPEFKWIGRL